MSRYIFKCIVADSANNATNKYKVFEGDNVLAWFDDEFFAARCCANYIVVIKDCKTNAKTVISMGVILDYLAVVRPILETYSGTENLLQYHEYFKRNSIIYPIQISEIIAKNAFMQDGIDISTDKEFIKAITL